MSSIAHRSVRSLLLAAALFASGAAHGGTPAVEPAEAFEHASTLMAEGKTVRARAMLLELTGAEASATLTDDQRSRAFQLLATADRRLREADPAEVSVQKAEMALLTDDLVGAEQHAMEVLGSGADRAAKSRAQAVVQLAAGRRASLAAVIGGAVDGAVDDFRQGNYAAAKAAFDRIARTGVTLDPQRARTLERYRSRIVDLELARGGSFETPAAMGLFGGDAAGSSWLLAQPDQARQGNYVIEDIGSDGTVPPEAFGATAVTFNQPQTQPDDVDVIESARRFEAKSLMGEADSAFAERRLSEAQQKYSRALNDYGRYLDAADSQRARDRIAELQVQLNVQGGPSGALQPALEDRELQRQRTIATFDNLMRQADAALEAGDPTTARDRVAQARLELNYGRAVLAEPDFEGRMDQVEAKISEINQREEQIRTSEAARQAEILARETAQRDAERLRERDQKINEALERVRALQMELKYDEALQVVDQILFLDPINPAGLLLKEVIQDTIVYRRYAELQGLKANSYADQFIENHEAMIAPGQLMNYPSDWPAISFRRGNPLDMNETAGDRSTRTALNEQSGPVLYDDNFLVDVLANIATRAAVDMDVDWNSLQNIGIEQETPVSLRLSSAPWTTVLTRVLDKVSDPTLAAGWSVQDGIVTIASEDVIRQKTVLSIYDINDLLFEVPYFDNAPEFDLSSVLSSGGGGGGSSPFSGGQGGQDNREDREERIEQIIQLVQNTIDPQGWVDLGGSTGTIQELNGNLIITQTPNAQREIVGLLDQLRQIRSLQINVEARFLLVSESFFEQIGFDIDFYFNPNNEFEINRTLDPSLNLSDYFDPETGRLVNNVSGGGLIFDSDGDTVPDAGFTQPVFPPGVQGDQFSVIRGAQDSFGITNSLIGASSGFAQSILASNPALGITGRFLDDIQVDFLIEATQADQRTVSLTAPRLTFMNGQRAFVAVATQQTFVSDLEPIVSDASVAFNPIVDTISAGVVLDVEGVISADRRYVTLTVLTSLSDFEFDPQLERDFQGAAGGTGGSVGGGEPATASIQIPVTQATTINTTVTIPDQGTVLLGGQRVVDEVEVESGVPVLSKIPVLNRFFSNRASVKEERTLMVLVRPTILIQDEEEEKNFPGLFDQLGG